MGFVELKPAVKPDGTGVKLSLSDRNGLIVTIWGEALLVLGGGEPGPCKVFMDHDPALPRLRIERHADGPFCITATPKGGEKRLVRVGHQPTLKAPSAKGLAASWEDVEDKPGTVDIDLPREFFPNRTVTTERAIGAPSTSSSGQRTTRVTMPAVRGG